MKDKTLVEIRPGVYQKAPTKVQMGFNKRIQKIPKSRVSDVERVLAIRGTFDGLARTNFNTRWVMKEHHIDKGYFKKVLILSEVGKKALKDKQGINYLVDNFINYAE